MQVSLLHNIDSNDFFLFCQFRFRNKMTEAGFTIAGSAHPICPVMLGDARLASAMADDMLKLGE